MEKEGYEAQIKALKEEIELLKKKQTYEIKRQKYGLNWIDVPEAFEKDSENKIPVLEEVKEKSIKNNDGKPTHILIEGDNYHALQCLNYTHKGKVDVIYIDPPYNKGKDFTYKDIRFISQYPDGTPVPLNSPLRHSYWLSFMSKRLTLAKNILKESGYVFISIDYNELYNLKLLCDQIFGENNFIGCISCQANPGGDKGDYLEVTLQYMIVYSKNKSKAPDLGTIEVVDSKKYKEKDEHGLYTRGGQLEKWGNDDTTHTHPNLAYSIYYNPLTKEVQHLFDYNQEEINKNRTLNIVYDNPNTDLIKNGYVCIRPRITNAGENGRWRMEPKTFYERLKNNDFIFQKTKDGYKIYEKERYQDGKFKKSKDFLSSEISKQTSDELLEIFGKKIFDYPKPLSLIKYIIGCNSSPSSTILDFFAGSGTTLHATMKLNEEDGGNRQCILVQLNENNICEEVTYERNRRVIQGYTNSKGEQIPGLGNSLKYYKTAFIGQNNCKNANDDDRTELAKKAGCLLSLGENTLDEICSTEYYQLFTGSKEATAVYFTDDYEKFDEFKEKVAELAPKFKKTFVYIFAWSSADDFAYEFEDIPNIHIKAIPLPILEIYKSIYNA